MGDEAADLEVGDTAGLETCATAAEATQRLRSPRTSSHCEEVPDFADLEVGDTAGLETCATSLLRISKDCLWLSDSLLSSDACPPPRGTQSGPGTHTLSTPLQRSKRPRSQPVALRDPHPRLFAAC
jgi:hypothetical protein